MTKWTSATISLKNDQLEAIQGRVYGQMYAPINIGVGSSIYNNLRGPLAASLFLNLSVVMDGIGHRTKWMKHG